MRYAICGNCLYFFKHESVLISNHSKTCGILYHVINASFPCLCLTTIYHIYVSSGDYIYKFLCNILSFWTRSIPKSNRYASFLLRIYIPNSTNLGYINIQTLWFSSKNLMILTLAIHTLDIILLQCLNEVSALGSG